MQNSKSKLIGNRVSELDRSCTIHRTTGRSIVPLDDVVRSIVPVGTMPEQVRCRYDRRHRTHRYDVSKVCPEDPTEKNTPEIPEDPTEQKHTRGPRGPNRKNAPRFQQKTTPPRFQLKKNRTPSSTKKKCIPGSVGGNSAHPGATAFAQSYTPAARGSAVFEVS